ncbi:uncharacterized mitochondrial protein AtMg00810-like [Brassica napus]|uniref:uncharacterized mitochondrial protein AtMg00810-like n=1 Tax=Brassica napus TaxID=3708 RepID=UPI0020789E6A|nr:uncharacterized mitochondrial protein AtMg00810-like [Brassica napus]
MVDEFVENMTQEFEMSMCGELKYFLGPQIVQSEEGVLISQSAYAHSLVKRFGLEDSKISRTHMSYALKLARDEAGEDVDSNLYRGMIDSLLYLTTSRPDLSFRVGVCARYQAKPKVSHLNVVKRIIKYVKGTENLGVYYSRNSNKNLVGYCDAD